MTLNLGDSVKYTYENAPRSKEELVFIGRFRLKDLAFSLGLGETSEARSSITNLKPPQLAEVVEQQLARMDAANGGAPSPQAAPVATPPPAPLAVVPVETPPAAEAPAAKPPRNPRASAAAAASAGAAQSLSPEVLAAIQSLVTSSAAQAQQVAQLVTQLNSLADAVSARFQDVLFRQDMSTALSLFFAEEVLGGSRPEILGQALTDMGDVADLVGKARQAKKQ